MNRGSGSNPPTTEGQKFMVLRCPFCGRKQHNQAYYSPDRIYPPGRNTFGAQIKCPKCGLTTTY